MDSLLFLILTVLAAAVLVVPVAKRLRLGAVVGYLLAGLALGPAGLSIIADAESVLRVGEMGVVFLFFLVGLELHPRRLWDLRHTIIGMGGSQLLFTTALLLGAGMAFGLPLQRALLVAMVLALSSTPFALQLLAEHTLEKTRAGEVAFSVLLFQDIAVVPMLALVPLLGAHVTPAAGNAWLAAGKAGLVVLAIVFAGPIATRPLFRLVANSGSRELFTAFSLLLVIGVSVLVNAVGLSMALGAFVGGVVLAESEYRHEVEIDLQPFKGLLMGLFFMAVGMSLDVPLLRAAPGPLVGLAVGLVTLKFGVMLVLAKASKIPAHQSWLLGALLCQGGEFGFVLFGALEDEAVLPARLVHLLVGVIVLSMALTPLVYAAAERIVGWRLTRRRPAPGAEPEQDAAGAPVIIAGFGRYGQVIDRLLSANRIRATVIDHDPEQIELLRRFGHQVFYGDATRLDLLRAAGAAEARLLIVALDDEDATLRLVDVARRHFPALPLLVRVRNRTQAYAMLDRGITDFERETFAAALNTGVKALLKLGLPREKASEAARLFHQHDDATLRRLYPVHLDQDKLISLTAQARADLFELMNAERPEEVEALGD
ncbi:MAG: cation:proton antiporter [Gammaproteobacteria bacterium]|nr:cation:proton antiporter [Gammaproteobacteria bacterium]